MTKRIALIHAVATAIESEPTRSSACNGRICEMAYLSLNAVTNRPTGTGWSGSEHKCGLCVRNKRRGTLLL